MRPTLALLVLASALVVAGCGSTRIVTQTQIQKVAIPPPAKDTGSSPALAKPAVRKGEIIVSGNTSPKTFGPYNFEPGYYTFRFEQYDPDTPNLDFATEASNFAVSLDRKPRVSAPDSQLLINSAQKQGDSVILVSGTYFIDVTSADHSYVLRFTPRS